MNTLISVTSSEGPLTDPATVEYRVYDHLGYENGCPNAATTYTIEVPLLAPSLVQIPNLECTACGIQLGMEKVS